MVLRGCEQRQTIPAGHLRIGDFVLTATGQQEIKAVEPFIAEDDVFELTFAPDSEPAAHVDVEVAGLQVQAAWVDHVEQSIGEGPEGAAHVDTGADEDDACAAHPGSSEHLSSVDTHLTVASIISAVGSDAK